MTAPNGSIRHGMFIMPFHDPAKPLAQCYDEDLELIVRAEELGFSEFWIGEHHTMKYENIVMPEIFIARALGETNTHPPGPGAGLPQPAPSRPRRQPAGVSRPSVARAGSTSASAPAASRPTRSCTAPSRRTPPRWSTRPST